MKSQSDRAMAENLFVRECRTLDQIAARLGVNRRTVGQWSSKGGWMKQRGELLRESPQAALDVLKRQREMLITAMPRDAPAGADQIDALHKLTLLIEKMESRLDAVGPMLDVFARFAQFVATNADDAACAVLREWTEKFLNDERRRSE
jgi:hypothetical protein